MSSQSRIGIHVLGLVVWFSMLSGLCPAATHYVSLSGSNTAPYLSWANAATTIQAAVNVSSNGDWVWVTNGTYRLDSTLNILTGVTVRSVNGAAQTILDGNAPVTNIRSLRVYHQNACVDGFSIVNGVMADGFGGGVWLSSGVIQNCIIASNRASLGGGINIDGGLLQNCEIFRNEAGSGGGLWVWSRATALCCRIWGNRATNATGSGGGAYLNGGGKIDRCLIFKNSAYSGAGLFYSGNGLAQNSFVYRNEASWVAGGVMFNYGGTVQNCTIVSNSAASIAGGISFLAGGTCVNSIVYFNVAPTESNVYNAASCSFCCSAPLLAGDGNIAGDPLLENIGAANIHLRAASPCVDAGTNLPELVSALDIDGQPRLTGERMDIGAVEAGFQAVGIDAGLGSTPSTWDVVLDARYQQQYCSEAAVQPWQDLGNIQTARQSRIIVTDPDPSSQTRLYRLIWLRP